MSCIHDIGNINVYTTCHVYVTSAAKNLQRRRSFSILFIKKTSWVKTYVSLQKEKVPKKSNIKVIHNNVHAISGFKKFKIKHIFKTDSFDFENEHILKLFEEKQFVMIAINFV